MSAGSDKKPGKGPNSVSLGCPPFEVSYAYLLIPDAESNQFVRFHNFKHVYWTLLPEPRKKSLPLTPFWFLPAYRSNASRVLSRDVARNEQFCRRAGRDHSLLSRRGQRVELAKAGKGSSFL